MRDEYLPGYVPALFRARVAQVGLVLFVAATAALRALQPVVLAIYGEGGYQQDGGGVDLATHGLFSVVVVLLGIGVTFVAIGAPIAVLVWLYRASKNAHAISVTGLHYSPGMAIGWWFVPFANLWHPLAVVRELETTSDPEGSFVPSSDTSWWWGCYLLGNILAFGNDAMHPTPFRMMTSAIATVAQAISAFMLIRIIERIGKNHEASSKKRRWADVFAEETRSAPEADAGTPWSAQELDPEE